MQYIFKIRTGGLMNKNLSNFLVPSEISTWSYKNEIIAALVNFLTAGYIIAVNPEILSQVGMSKSALVSATSYLKWNTLTGKKRYYQFLCI